MPVSRRMLPGARIGPYEISQLLGAGGMGEVYRARDTKLRREVAIKVLPQHVAHDPDRLQRFERESHLLAALNHPHIAAIYGFEEEDGITALILELVEGPTLAARIATGPVRVDEAIAIARQIADALEAAHERGIIHRDLKPANVKLTPEGIVKVLDFGLAKAESTAAELPDAPTVTTAAGSSAGVIMGTAPYMSPEQARGKPVDKRTDIWAFGCVLYEMLSGRVAFPGDTVSDALVAVLEREPDWGALPVARSSPLRRLLARCLEKDPRRRLRDIGDARFELDEALADSGKDDAVGQKQHGISRRTAIGTLAGATAGAVATGLFAVSRYRGAVPRDLTQFAIAMPDGEFADASFNRRVAISPDGTRIAFKTGRLAQDGFVYVRSLNELESRRMKDIQGVGLAFSPDNRWLAYCVTRAGMAVGWRKLALSGGASVTICPTDNFLGVTWADDDTLYFVPELPGGVVGVPASGGAPAEIVKIDFAGGERQHRYPCALPGGKALLFTTGTADISTFDEARIVAFSRETGRKKVLVEGGTHPRYSPSGHLLYAHDAKILAMRFDAARLETSGQPFPVLDGVLMSRNTGVANDDVSATGDLVYIPGICEGGGRTLVWVDQNGRPEPLGLPARSYLHPRLSPDDRRLAVEIEGPSHDLHTYEFDRGVFANVTTDGVSHWPVWSPDGNQLGYRAGPMARFRLWQVPIDRSRPPEQLPATGQSQSAESWSPDGRAIAYTVRGPGTPPSIMVARLDGTRSVQPMAAGNAPAGSSKFSPEGRWLAYCSSESGRPQVYVQAFPGPGPKVQVSTDGGTDPVWKRTGGELYYRNGDLMMAVDVSTKTAFSAGRPRGLWKGHYAHGMSSSCGAPGATSSNYDVTADGSRFLMIKDDDQDRATSSQIVVVLGWAAAVSRRSAQA